MNSRHLLHHVYKALAPGWVRSALQLALLDIERFAAPRTVERPPGNRVLVLAPHPDDESIGCGGTLCKYADAGIATKVVVLTDGRQGDPALRQLPPADPARLKGEAELVLRRQAEAQAALNVLGVEESVFLDLPDGQLREHVYAAAARLAEILVAWRPDVVLLPFLSDRHADHFAANTCLMQAVERADGAWKAGLLCLGYEVWSPVHANLYVDIDAAMERKRRAIRCHASQDGDMDYLAGIEGLNRYRAISGLVAGAYAEAFFLAPLPAYRRLYAKMLL